MSIFAGLTSGGGSGDAWNPWDTTPRALDPQTLKWLQGQINGSGDDNRIIKDGFEYRPYLDGYNGGMGESGDGVIRPGTNVTQWNRIKLGEDGKPIGRDWEAYDPSGKYGHTWIESTGTWMDKNGWVLPLAAAGAGWFLNGGLPGAAASTGAATGASSAAGSLIPGVTDILAPGMLESGFLSTLPEAGSLFTMSGAPGLSGLGLTGMAGTGAGAAAGLGSTLLDGAKNLGNKAVDFLGSNAGKLIGTGLGLAAIKNAKQGAPDPMLQEGAAGVKDIAKSATDRAATQDDFFNNTFLPQYLEMMNRADTRDRELYDFNMGRARLAAGQMDKFYNAVDAYDNEANTNRMAGEAVAAARQSNAANRAMLARNMQRTGVNPNSGVWASNLRQAGQQDALSEAMAANMARRGAEQAGLNLRASAAGLRGADLGYSGAALGGADLGMRGVAGAQTGWNANNAGWNATMGLAGNAFGQLGGWGLSRSNSADQIALGNTTGRNQLIGYGLGRLWGG